MRELFHPDPHEFSLPTVFHALSDPIRLEIVRTLASTSEQSCGWFDFKLTKSTLSHHFRVLREAGVIRTRMAGTQRFISLRQEDLEARFPGLLVLILHDASSHEQPELPAESS